LEVNCLVQVRICLQVSCGQRTACRGATLTCFRAPQPRLPHPQHPQTRVWVYFSISRPFLGTRASDHRAGDDRHNICLPQPHHSRFLVRVHPLSHVAHHAHVRTQVTTKGIYLLEAGTMDALKEVDISDVSFVMQDKNEVTAPRRASSTSSRA
jgi:hypothetical protein